MHIIVAVVDGRVPHVIVEVKRRGDRFQGLVNQFGWYPGHFAREINSGPSIGDELQGLVAVNAHAWVPEQLVGLRQDALDSFLVK